jgi:hypothetical protein
MCRWSLIAASSSFHLTNSSNRHVGNTECRKLKLKIWIVDIWHDVHNNFMDFRQVFLYLLNIYKRTSPLRVLVGLGYVRLAHAQTVINSGVIKLPPHEFNQPSFPISLSVVVKYAQTDIAS